MKTTCNPKFITKIAETFLAKRQSSYSTSGNEHQEYANRMVTPEIKEDVKAAIVTIQGSKPHPHKR